MDELRIDDLFYLPTDQIEYPEDDRVGKPHEDNTDDDIEDDIFGFFHLLFITTTDENLESSIDNIDDSNERDKSEEIDDDTLCIY